MTRRELIASAVLAPAVRSLFAKTRMDKSRLSAITDEIGLTPEQSIEFTKQYGLRWVEVRGVPGSKPRREYALLDEAELKQAAASFAANGLRVSFINTSLLKFAWPGTEPVNRKPESDEARQRRLATEQKRWDNRQRDVLAAVTTAKILSCDKIRIFTGSRVADPQMVVERVAKEIGQLSEIAAAQNVHLLVENEGSQNVGTSAELAGLMERLPFKWIGLNWDPQNALTLKETPFPDGYALLPKKRILNVQFKGKGIMQGSPEKLDWRGIIQALNRDSYSYELGLETHIFDGTLISAAHESMEDMLRIVG